MIQPKINGSPGFSNDLSIESVELARLRHLIYDQWLRYLKTIAPEHVKRFEECVTERYH